MPKNKLIIIIVAVILVLSLGISSIMFFGLPHKKFEGRFYLETLTVNHTDYSYNEQASWDEEKWNEYYQTIKDINDMLYDFEGDRKYFKNTTLKAMLLFDFDMEDPLYSIRFGYRIFFDGRDAPADTYLYANIKLKGTKVVYIQQGGDHSNMFPLQGEPSYFTKNGDKSKIKFVLQELKDNNGNTYKFTYGRNESNRLSLGECSGEEGSNNNNNPNPDPDPGATYTNYKLNKLYVKSLLSGVADTVIDPNSMSAQDQALYGTMLDMYGRTLKLYSNKVEFSGTALSLYNPAAFTKSGDNITFTDTDTGTDPELSELFSATVANGKFNLTIKGANLVFEYVLV
ncbi:MAG: hypothetical protein LBT20_02470 [Clostridiales bacterium]|nr:hypothetical protein [Clostridiales bacterium]